MMEVDTANAEQKKLLDYSTHRASTNESSKAFDFSESSAGKKRRRTGTPSAQAIQEALSKTQQLLALPTTDTVVNEEPRQVADKHQGSSKRGNSNGSGKQLMTYSVPFVFRSIAGLISEAERGGWRQRDGTRTFGGYPRSPRAHS